MQKVLFFTSILWLCAACTVGYNKLDSGPRPDKQRTDYPLLFPDQEQPDQEQPDQERPDPDQRTHDARLPDGPIVNPDLPIPLCNNNNTIENQETCDGTALGSHTCKTAGFDDGILSCTNQCALDTSLCFRCGDNVKNDSEICDGSDLNNLTCATLGLEYDAGDLACLSDCTFNVSGCFDSCPPITVVQSCANDFCQITSGCFKMGSPPEEPCREAGEVPHNVTLTHHFEIMQFPVTQTQYQNLIGSNPSVHLDCANCPVENLDWHSAIAYCNALSVQAGYTECYACTAGICTEATAYTNEAIYNCPGYRLPTEAEFEYAYRAGTTGAIYLGTYTGHATATDCADHLLPDADVDPIGWFAANSGQVSQPVGGKTPNAWGLYDMAGNVSEWSHDRSWDLTADAVTNPWGGLQGDDRIVRGGHVFREAATLRAAFRLSVNPNEKRSWVGFRCVRTTSF